MSKTRQTILASRPAAMVLALSLVAGLSAPFMLLPRVNAAPIVVVPDGTTELSPAPVDQTNAVPPNIAVTFDDSGSMQWDFLSDNPPFLTVSGNQNVPVNVTWGGVNADTGNRAPGGPWYCAGLINPTATSGIGTHVMNGVYYNPNITYVPPIHADGTSFPEADASLTAVENDGDSWNRYDGPDQSDGTTDFMKPVTGTGYWNCPYDYIQNQQYSYYAQGYYLDQVGNQEPLNTNPTSPVSGSGGGPYYYQLTAAALAQLSSNLDQFGNPTLAGLKILYKASNWQAVPVPQSQYQNWANWWAYYRTHNQAARTALSRVFGAQSMAAKTSDGGYGTDMRVVWQNLNNGNFKLPGSAIISALIDTSSCGLGPTGSGASANPYNIQRSGATQTPPDCYRSAFFNWIFQVGASGSTPTRSALVRAGKFFQRGAPGSSQNSTLEDPYWQPPQTGTVSASNPGNELYCRQNFHLLLTDGLWNQDQNYAIPALPTSLPDGVAFPVPGGGNVTSIYAPVHDVGTNSASLSDLSLQYWATDLRPDLYDPTNGQFVPPYLPDSSTNVFGGGGTVQFVTGQDANGNPTYTTVPTEEYFNPDNDPATWPHMSEYLVGMGVVGNLNFSENTDCTNTTDPTDQDACDLRKGIANSTGAVGWPNPNSQAAGGNGLPANIDDTWHAALDGRGQFFSAGNPQQLVDQLTSVLSSIAARSSTPAPGAVNASVVTTGAVSFSTSHGSDWSGELSAVALNTDGSIGSTLWDVNSTLDSRSYTSRNIYTDAYSGGTFNNNIQFTAANANQLDATEVAGLETPALSTDSGSPDYSTTGLANRINYIAGDQTYATGSVYRKRTHLLGAIIHSQPVYVAYPSSNYYNNWPSGSPEIATGAESYDTFQTDYAKRAPTVYVGANDGMLHAFNAPVPTCTSYDSSTGVCSNYTTGTDPGKEDWAFIPRAVYANLGNLTSATDFNFRPTVDATPVTRDVFFSEGTQTPNDAWHTLLAGGVGVGGRGVYALDITGPAPGTPGAVIPPATKPDVLWEFDSDMTITSSSCTAISGTGLDTTGGGCRSTDLGYTISQPNIARLATGTWAVLVPNGYFPDCSKPDIPTADKTSCQTIANQAPKYADGDPYSALFVLDAETGKVIAELKTPDLGSQGIYSFGLATPVLGNFNGGQVDSVAFAGDAEGNLWRFDLSSSNPENWTVTLAYQAPTQGLQPITTMPRLFPDPTTNGFMVVFGTGMYLGAGDNGNNAIQAVYGIRAPQIAGAAVQQTSLVQQFMSETEVAASTLPGGSSANPAAEVTLRCVTGTANSTCGPSATPANPVPASAGGWYFNLDTTVDGTQTDAGERVVVTPGAVFATNTVIIPTLMTGTKGSNPCNPSTQGAILFIDATSGGPGRGVSSLGGYPYVGARVNNARTSGSLPIVSALGGGQLYIPGMTLSGSNKPISGDLPIWRRRSWQEINQ